MPTYIHMTAHGRICTLFSQLLCTLSYIPAGGGTLSLRGRGSRLVNCGMYNTIQIFSVYGINIL